MTHGGKSLNTNGFSKLIAGKSTVMMLHLELASSPAAAFP
jgi:hypothetical protein